MFVASSSVQTTEPIITKFVPKIYFWSKYMDEKNVLLYIIWILKYVLFLINPYFGQEPKISFKFFTKKLLKDFDRNLCQKEVLEFSLIWYATHSPEMFSLLKIQFFANFQLLSPETVNLILANFAQNMYCRSTCMDKKLFLKSTHIMAKNQFLYLEINSSNDFDNIFIKNKFSGTNTRVFFI